VLITDCSDAALITPFEQAGIKVLVAQADTVSDSLKDANAA
jgi:predicted Fe-Mo cluster-binding NifX family protein